MRTFTAVVMLRNVRPFSLVAAALCLVFAACGGGNGGSSKGDKLTAKASTTSATAMVRAAVPFDAGASKNAQSYSWDFGDGGHGGAVAISHAYATAGTYTVTLTVSDGNGTTVATTKSIVVTAGATPGALIGVFAHVQDTTSTPLAGVTLSEGATTATSDANGNVRMQLAGGVIHTLAIHLDGYAEQYHTVDYTTAQAGYFTATLVQRAATQPFDADQGGTLTSTTGVSITLPPSALVDASGRQGHWHGRHRAHTGRSGPGGRNGFPGTFTGTAKDSSNALLASFGTTEFALLQNGQRLQLAPGLTADIIIPLFAGADYDGSPVNVGDTIPLWSLNEGTGNWVQEGVGTIVASSAAPTALAMQTTVSHFSWYNCDSQAQSTPPAGPGLQCKCETDEEVCVMLGRAAFTCHLTAQGSSNPSGAGFKTGPRIEADGGTVETATTRVELDLFGSTNLGVSTRRR